MCCQRKIFFFFPFFPHQKQELHVLLITSNIFQQCFFFIYIYIYKRHTHKTVYFLRTHYFQLLNPGAIKCVIFHHLNPVLWQQWMIVHNIRRTEKCNPLTVFTTWALLVFLQLLEENLLVFLPKTVQISICAVINYSEAFRPDVLIVVKNPTKTNKQNLHQICSNCIHPSQ